jgi:hypothetical protein
MRVASDHHDFGIDLTGKRETTIDREKRIFSVLKARIENQRDFDQGNFWSDAGLWVSEGAILCCHSSGRQQTSCQKLACNIASL